MICHCGKETWLYDAHTLTCKLGHRTPVVSALAPTHVRKSTRDWITPALLATNFVLAVIGLFT